MNEETAHDLFEGLIFQLKRIGDQLEALNGTLLDVSEDLALIRQGKKTPETDPEETLG